MAAIELLIRSVTEPKSMAELNGRQWETALRLGRLHAVSGRWYGQLESSGLLERLPAPVVKHLWSDRLIAEENERRVRWETDRVHRALKGLNLDIVLLKGAAYIMLGLAPGKKRLASDVDILVALERLDIVEEALARHGWRLKAGDSYDEHYYRAWMHELPPMQHNVRGSWLDVHHNLVPRTSRLKLDGNSLLERAVPIPGTPYFALCPEDMLIHSILHGFYGGEFLNAFRDVLDVHELATDLGAREPSFWKDFSSRVKALKIERPVHYALRYATRIFNTEVPHKVLVELARGTPGIVTGMVMDLALNAVIDHQHPPRKRELLAARLLLARSHWLKMPPWMLFKHLSRKSLKRLNRLSDAA